MRFSVANNYELRLLRCPGYIVKTDWEELVDNDQINDNRLIRGLTFLK